MAILTKLLHLIFQAWHKYGAAGFRARISHSLTKGSASGLMTQEADCSSNMLNLSNITNPDGSLSKMSLGCSTVTKDAISKFSCKSWMNSGMAFRGEYLMLNTLEHHNDAEGSMLSQVLETSAPLNYFLSPKQLQSLIDRASARKKSLPKRLEQVFRRQIALLSEKQLLEESNQSEQNSQPNAKKFRKLYVRRMMPSEYEILQGFPKGWTEIDTRK